MSTTHRSVGNTLVIVIVLGLALWTVPGHAARPADEIGQVSPEAGNAVRDVEGLLESPSTITQALPANPTQALIDATSALSSELGFQQDTSARIMAADLPEEVAGRLALVVDDLLACTRITAAHLAAIGDNMEQVAQDGGGLDPAQFADIRTCSDSLWTSSVEMETSLQSLLTPTDPTNCDLVARRSIDIWPVLRFDA
ncbi:MAG: hypothetical protein ACRDHO_10080, partial [Actinomycetota bacterium]